MLCTDEIANERCMRQYIPVKNLQLLLCDYRCSNTETTCLGTYMNNCMTGVAGWFELH